MRSSKSNNNCIYNLIYVKFNEDMDIVNYFSHNLQYPTFYSFNNTYFYVHSTVLNNINSTIKSDVYIFKDGLFEEEKDFNDLAFKINQNKDWYYEDVFIDIPDDQAFYLTDEGIVIYFELDEIAPQEFGIPKFKMLFDKFAPYINPRFYCIPQNVNSFSRRKHNLYR